jgi:4-amino-4-deoxy-L-arabinose transferase-like glycosyltransferase
VFLGLAMLAKGLVPVVLAAPLLWVGRRRPLDLLAMGLAALAVATPWYLQVWRVNGGAFIDEFFWKHHFARLVSEEIQHAQPWWFFVPVLLGLLFPWSPALAALRGLDWSELRRLLLLLWAAWGLLFFSAATNKLPGYILPLLPAFAALIGIGCARKVPRYAVAACALLVALVPVAAGVLPTAILEGLSRAAISDIPWLAVALVLVAAAGVGFFSQAPVLPTAALMAAAVLWLVYSAFPALDRTASGRAWWLNASTAGDVFCVDTEHRGVRYGVFYYAGRELPACTASRERNHVNLDRDLGETR